MFLLMVAFGVRKPAKGTKFINSVGENFIHSFVSVLFGIFIKIYLVSKMFGGIEITNA